MSFDTFSFDGQNQHWPANVPPASALAAGGLRHAGNDLIVCSVCHVVIPADSFRDHDLVGDVHYRVTGKHHDFGPRQRKRSLKVQEDAMNISKGNAGDGDR